MTASAHRTRPLIAVRLDLPDWDSVLDALGVAAELTTVHLDVTCDICQSVTGSCPTHDDDWDHVDRWRTLATALRHQLTATPPTRTGSPR